MGYHDYLDAYHISRLPILNLLDIKTTRQVSQIYNQISLLNMRREKRNIRNYTRREATYRSATQGCVRLHKHNGRLSAGETIGRGIYDSHKHRSLI